MTARLFDLAGIDVEDGVSAADGLPFCLVRATATTGDVHMLAVANADLPDEQRQELVGSALVFLRQARARHEAEAELADEGDR
jgi:hypothetical protein